jgi:hypothetical protein
LRIDRKIAVPDIQTCNFLVESDIPEEYLAVEIRVGLTTPLVWL